MISTSGADGPALAKSSKSQFATIYGQGAHSLSLHLGTGTRGQGLLRVFERFQGCGTNRLDGGIRTRERYVQTIFPYALYPSYARKFQHRALAREVPRILQFRVRRLI